MAKLTGDGKVLSSGKGVNGMRVSWSLAQVWVTVDLKFKADTVRSLKQRIRGGGNG